MINKRKNILTLLKNFTFNIPNIICLFRLISAPLLVIIAINMHKNLFIILLTVSFFSDYIDGFLARLLNQTSKFGAILDSFADLILIVFAWSGIIILWPEIFIQEKLSILIILFCEMITNCIGFIKFKRMICFHTYIGKFAFYLMSISMILIIIFEKFIWLLRITAITYIVVAIEDLLIIYILSEWLFNIPTLWHAYKIEKK
jgi:CDP-diacylglycerol--glycerol-3-phosphate 3-phosphatidyltransferase